MEMASGLDKSLSEIIGRNGRRLVSKSKHTQVFVGNLPWETTWQKLKDLCQEYGDVKRADIEQHPDGNSKGYGIVSFVNSSDAKACVEGLDGHDLDGRELNVKFDEKKSNKRMNKARGSTNCQVWVGNLPYSVKWQVLKDMCKDYGFVTRVDIEETDNGYSKGYGIVLFETNAAARACINSLNGYNLDGRELTVKFDEKESSQVIVTRKRQKFSNTDSQIVGNHFLLSDELSSQQGSANFQLWVGNLPFNVRWQELKDLCKEYGFVTRVDISTDDDGRSKGYAIVGFKDHASARACIEDLNGSSLGGRELIVKFDEKAGLGTSSVVYVGNLPWSVKWQELKGMCQSFGFVIHVDIPENDEGGSKGYALVKYEDTDSAQNCIKHLNGKVLNGRELLARFDIFNGISNNHDPATVYVGNLPYTFNKWSDLKNLCRTFGDVIRVDIAEDEDGRSKGYATVKFANGFSARNCIQRLNGKLLNGRRLNVKADRFKN